MMQKSVWISPHPFEEDMKVFLRYINLDSYCHVFVSQADDVDSNKSMASDIWEVDKINESYLEIIKSYKAGEIEAFSRKYLDIISSDPFLPRELLPRPWYADSARRIFAKINSRS